METSTLRKQFYGLAFFLFLFLMYQGYHDSHYPPPALIMDSLRRVFIITMFAFLIWIAKDILKAFLEERRKLKFAAEEKIRLERADAMDSDGWRGGGNEQNSHPVALLDRQEDS